jgi:hypothetical protein
LSHDGNFRHQGEEVVNRYVANFLIFFFVVNLYTNL